MKRHMKGHLLETLAHNGRMWDHDLTDDVMQELGLVGDYWYGTVHLTLTDLYAGGLISEAGATVDLTKSRGQEKVLFQFELTDFGRMRMVQAGLGRDNAGRDDS